MMGHTHALSGLAAGAATLPAAPVSGVREQLLWTACWGGMALVPDLDMRGTTSARMWGPVSAAAATIIGWFARGHRQGTHDIILAPLAFAAIAAAASTTDWGARIILAIAIGLGLHAIHFVIPGDVERTWPGNLAISAALSYWLTGHNFDSAWLPVAVAGGVVVHILGDALTTEKVPVPVTWLFPRKYRLRLGIPITRTNTWLEPVVSFGCIGLGSWQLLLHTGVLAAYS
ncbi:MAG: metal-dependent hydrolase [Angustibacter sp.]